MIVVNRFAVLSMSLCLASGHLLLCRCLVTECMCNVYSQTECNAACITLYHSIWNHCEMNVSLKKRVHKRECAFMCILKSHCVWYCTVYWTLCLLRYFGNSPLFLICSHFLVTRLWPYRFVTDYHVLWRLPIVSSFHAYIRVDNCISLQSVYPPTHRLIVHTISLTILWLHPLCPFPHHDSRWFRTFQCAMTWTPLITLCILHFVLSRCPLHSPMRAESPSY